MRQPQADSKQSRHGSACQLVASRLRQHGQAGLPVLCPGRLAALACDPERAAERTHDRKIIQRR